MCAIFCYLVFVCVCSWVVVVLCAFVCLCFECVFWDVFETLCVFLCRCVRVLAQVRVDQTPQKGEVRTVTRGKDYSRGTHGGTHRVLSGYSRGTGEFLPYREYWRDPTIPNAMAAHQTLH